MFVNPSSVPFTVEASIPILLLYTRFAWYSTVTVISPISVMVVNGMIVSPVSVLTGTRS